MRAKTKDLANLLADEKTLIILDDAEVTLAPDHCCSAHSVNCSSSADWCVQRVWPKHQANLLTVGRYHYFRQSAQSFGEPPESACIAHGEEDAELGAQLLSPTCSVTLLRRIPLVGQRADGSCARSVLR